MPECKKHGELPQSAFVVRSSGWHPPWCRECEREKARQSRRDGWKDDGIRARMQAQSRQWRKRASMAAKFPVNANVPANALPQLVRLVQLAGALPDRLPCSLEDLRVHLEKQFEPGMDWNGAGTAWTLQHVIPPKMFENQTLCWSLDNLQPWPANKTKPTCVFDGAKTFEQFMQAHRVAGHLPPDESIQEVLVKLQSCEVKDDHVPQSLVGLSFLDNRFPHRFQAKTEGFKSFHEAWNSEAEWLRVAAYIARSGRPVTKKLVITNMKFSVSLPAHFFPSTAAALVNKFGSGDVFDPFLGWGGRALGAIGAKCSSFTGTDLQQLSVDGCKKVAADCGYGQGTFFCEDFNRYMQQTDRRFDVVMTSPPFFDTEAYGVPGSKGQGWVEHIAKPLVDGAARVLRPGGVVIVHGQDRPNLAVLSCLLACFLGAGFENVSEYKYGKRGGQKVVIFRCKVGFQS
jgi:hypothetical protein